MMSDVDNSMFGGADNAAHFERDGVAIDISADVFWDAVAGKCKILPNTVELALAAETVECMCSVMPVRLDKPYEIDDQSQKMFDNLLLSLSFGLKNFNTFLIDDLLTFKIPVHNIYYCVTCLKTKISIAVAKGVLGRRILYTNSNDYMLMYQSIEDFISDIMG